MKKVLIILGIAAVVGCSLLIYVVFKAGGVVLKAQGQSLYSGAGAWSRIQEFARAQGKANYIAEADSNLKFLEDGIKQWRESAQVVGLDITSFEKMRATAYETTDRNIKMVRIHWHILMRPNQIAPANRWSYLCCKISITFLASEFELKVSDTFFS